MPGIKGKLPKGSTGYLEITDGVVRLWEETGLIGKRQDKLSEFPLKAATSTQLLTGEPPFRRLHRLKIDHGADGELVFFSDDRPALEAARDEVDRDIEDRRMDREREQAQRKRVRETHVHRITLLLELLDQVFQMVIELDGVINWDLMKGTLAEMGQIREEMTKIDVETPLSYDEGELSMAIRRRLVDDIKKECYAVIEAVHRDAGRLAAMKEPPEATNLFLYEMFVNSYIVLWDLRLGEFVGDDLNIKGLDVLRSYLMELDELAPSDEPTGGLEQIRQLPTATAVAPHFDNVRSLIHRYLNGLVK